MSDGTRNVELSRRTRDCLLVIETVLKSTGVGPSIREIAVLLGNSPKSKAAIQRHLIELEDKGFIARRSKCARAIELLRPLTPRPSAYDQHLMMVRAFNAPPPSIPSGVILNGLSNSRVPPSTREVQGADKRTAKRNTPDSAKPSASCTPLSERLP